MDGIANKSWAQRLQVKQRPGEEDVWEQNAWVRRSLHN